MNNPCELDPRDRLLQAHAPAVMVPRHGVLALPHKPGHRFLVASDGVWLEVLRPWLHARVPVAVSEIPLPFGDVGQVLTYAFTEVDVRAVERRFLQDAERAFPNECAAWAVYDENTGRIEYRPLVADAASPASVTFHRPALASHEHLAIDIHSHGALGAGFSGTDDEDDAGEVKYAIVLGNINGELSRARRLCLQGLFVDLDGEGPAE
jgi:PRTRC genetic system protein A